MAVEQRRNNRTPKDDAKHSALYEVTVNCVFFPVLLFPIYVVALVIFVVMGVVVMGACLLVDDIYGISYG